jgi:hypothetical protein
MDIRKDFSIIFDEQVYINARGEGFERFLKRPGMRTAFEEILCETRELVRPIAGWDRFPIREVTHNKVVLANGAKIGDETVIKVVGGASELFVALCTIGPEADDRIRQYLKDNDLLKATLLDEMASWGVDLVRQQVCVRIEEGLTREGLRASAPLSPGESAWSVRDQAVIFSLLDAAQINMSLSESMVMYPIKSLSLVLGAGTQAMGVEGATNCDFCTMRDTCNYRRMRVNVQRSMI